jgi:cytoskeletal protein RodZ
MRKWWGRLLGTERPTDGHKTKQAIAALVCVVLIALAVMVVHSSSAGSPTPARSVTTNQVPAAPTTRPAATSPSTVPSTTTPGSASPAQPTSPSTTVAGGGSTGTSGVAPGDTTPSTLAHGGPSPAP